MTKNVTVVNGNPPSPLGATYPRRARQLVKQGRAEWIDETTLRLLHGPPNYERADDMANPNIDNRELDQNEWVAYFRALVQSVIENDEAVKAAVAAIANIANFPPHDQPSQAISRIVATNNELKTEALRTMNRFVSALMGLDEREKRPHGGPHPHHEFDVMLERRMRSSEEA